MAGILDEVMDGIAAKEKQDGKTPAAQPATPPAPGQTPATDKPLNTYSKDFQEKYGDRGGKKDKTA